MKFGLVFSLWLLLCPLFAQDCEEIAIGPVHYYEGTGPDKVEIESYFIPCDKTPDLSFSLPLLPGGYSDPDLSTPAGIILVLLLRDPGQSLISITDFSDLMYTDVNGQPIYFSDPGQAIQVSDLLNIGNDSNQYALMPVLVDNASGEDPATWFEDDCVRLFPKENLTLIENPVEEYEFSHFDEITFTHWPLEIPITAYFDFTFSDRETDEEIPFNVTDNNSFRLKFPKVEGGLNFKLDWKKQDCGPLLGFGDNWSFPTVELVMDTVMGYRNIEKCVPLRAFNFESVTSFEFSLSWDAGSLDFTAVKSIHPDLEPFLKIGDIFSSGDKNNLIIELPAQHEPLTLPDSAVLFEWCGKPLADPGQYVEMNYSSGEDEPEPHFNILGLETSLETSPGGIIVQEDREIIYDLIQLCNTRDGRHRIELDIVNDEAYPYFYSFHSELIPDSTVHSIPFIIPDVPPGQYEFTIRDSFGFEITETYIVSETVPSGFEMFIDPAQVIQPTCLHPFGGQIGIDVTPSDQSYQYNLLNDDAVFTGDSVSGLVAGIYIIEAENEAGCIDTIHYTLQNPREINVTWEDNLVFCPGEQEIILLVEDQSSSPDTSVEFQLDGGEIRKLGDSIFLKAPGVFTLQLWNADGCTLDTTVVIRSAPDEMVVWDTTSVRIQLGDTLKFNAPNPEGLSMSSWEFSGKNIGNQILLKYVPQQSGVLYYNASVYKRCLYSDSLMVDVILPDQEVPEFNFPNVFTPNGDGVNDVYSIVPTREIQQIQRMEVFDRYGNFIFEKVYNKDTVGHMGWDGKSSGMEVPQGVYAVLVELQLYDGREETVSFDVLLLR